LDKSPDAFRTISEAAEELDLPQHVLRFWETRFSTIKPLKRGGGRRYYRPDDVLLLKGIRHLLYDQGFTIKGVQRILKDQGVRHVAAVGNGTPLEALSSQALPHDDDATAPNGSAQNGATHGHALDADDREKLNGALREMLECKRILERAREG
jgi:DNA-binding transcriptional MerR regulator